MGSDHDIHLTFFQILNRFFLLGRSPKTAQQIHTHGKFLHSLDKCIIMLLGQNGRRNQVHDLAALLNFLERRPQSDFRFPVAYISAHQSIHNLRAFHITLGILNGSKLILCLLIGKHFLKLLLPYRIRSADIAFLFLTGCVKLHQFLCDILYCTSDLCFGTIPFLSAQFVQLRNFGSVRTGIFLQRIQLRCKNIEIAAVPVLNLDVILDDLIHFNLFDTAVNTQSVLFMYDIISDGQLRKILDTIAVICFFLLFFLLFLAENIRFRNNRKLYKGIFKAMSGMSVNHHNFSRIDNPVIILPVKSVQPLLQQILCQTFCPGTGA